MWSCSRQVVIRLQVLTGVGGERPGGGPYLVVFRDSSILTCVNLFGSRALAAAKGWTSAGKRGVGSPGLGGAGLREAVTAGRNLAGALLSLVCLFPCLCHSCRGCRVRNGWSDPHCGCPGRLRHGLLLSEVTGRSLASTRRVLSQRFCLRALCPAGCQGVRRIGCERCGPCTRTVWCTIFHDRPQCGEARTERGSLHCVG